MDKTDFYDWQLEAFDRIEGRSAVLSAPTGSGKTLVAYLWAGLLDREGQVCWPDAHRRSEERRVGKECRSRWSPYH